MIDEDFRLWLIEVNTNPYLGIPNTFIGIYLSYNFSHFLENLLPKMMDDMIKLLVDPSFPPKVIPESKIFKLTILRLQNSEWVRAYLFRL